LDFQDHAASKAGRQIDTFSRDHLRWKCCLEDCPSITTSSVRSLILPWQQEIKSRRH
jgi:hypothetical protein